MVKQAAWAGANQFFGVAAALSLKTTSKTVGIGREGAAFGGDTPFAVFEPALHAAEPLRVDLHLRTSGITLDAGHVNSLRIVIEEWNQP